MKFLRMSATAALIAAFAAAPVPARTAEIVRPAITGISHYSVYSSDMEKTRKYYVEDLHATQAPDPENPNGVRYYVNGKQFVQVLPLPSGNTSINRLDHLAFETANAEQLRRYLRQRGVTVPKAVTRGTDGSLWFHIKDNEGNTVEFIQSPPAPVSITQTPIGSHMIHFGILVHDAERQNRLYRDILGFRPYWQGGMKPTFTDWIAQQVPDGTDWIEYMMVDAPEDSGIPAGMRIEALGTMDHIALGVPDMQGAVGELVSGERISGARPPASGGRPGRSMSIGLDGKWQYNLFDPDGVRTELMEFEPVVKPCCSEFSGPHPGRNARSSRP